jgi:Ca-activated chloride channel family protein
MNMRRVLRSSTCLLAAIAVVIGCAEREPPPDRGLPAAPAAEQLTSADESQAGGRHALSIDTVPIVARGPFSDTYFQHYGVNPTFDTAEQVVSTFGVNVDTASYNLTRSYLGRHVLPGEDAVRVEEFVNAFDYGYAAPNDGALAISAEAFPSPNRQGYHLLEIGLKARESDEENRRPLHLVFVIDTSGSMAIDDRLGLVRASLKLLIQQLGERDTVAIVSFNTAARVDIEPTSATDRARLGRALDSLTPDGSTNVEAGLRLGYRLAEQGPEGGVRRVILLSDGVANTGITEADAIYDTVREKAAKGISVTTIGVGLANFNDALLNRFAQLGKGNYFYVDGQPAARRIFVEQLAGTLEAVARYRLLGFESRALHTRDFDDDHVDGGEMGVGHSVTALYEVKLLRTDANLGQVSIRYKAGREETSVHLTRDLPPRILRSTFRGASSPARLALVAGAFAEKLHGSYWARNLSYEQLEVLWRGIDEPLRLRKDVVELGQLIRDAEAIDRRGDPFERQTPVAHMDFDHLPVLQ